MDVAINDSGWSLLTLLCVTSAGFFGDEDAHIERALEDLGGEVLETALP